MYRVDNATATTIKPASTGAGPKPDAFYDNNTIVEHEHLNAIQEEVSSLIESAGLTLNKADDKQMQAALDLLGLEPAQFRAREAAVPDMTVVIAAGKIQNATTVADVAQQTTAAFVAPTTNPRIDRVVIDKSTGIYSVVAGTEAASPAAPELIVNALPVCQILFQTATTEIINSMITDERSVHEYNERFVWLDTPELLTVPTTANTWLTVSSTTLANAKAKRALIGASFGTGFIDSINHSADIFFRKTGSGSSANASTRIAHQHIQSEVSFSAQTEASGRGEVQLDGSYDFDIEFGAVAGIQSNFVWIVGYWV